MKAKNKKNIVLMAIVATIVLVFSISNRIKQQKVYVLSNETTKGAVIDDDENNLVEQADIGEIDIGEIVVHIEGEVKNPGVYELNKNARVFDAIDKAGGLSKDADCKRVNLAKKIADEEYIYIPNKDEEDIEFQYRDNLSATTNTIENTNLININKANIMEIKELPGIGDVLANRIIEYRNETGGFKSVDELKNVSGIGDKKFNDIKDKVTIN